MNRPFNILKRCWACACRISKAAKRQPEILAGLYLKTRTGDAAVDIMRSRIRWLEEENRSLETQSGNLRRDLTAIERSIRANRDDVARITVVLNSLESANRDPPFPHYRIKNL